MLEKDTLVTLADGTKKKAMDVSYGDQLLGPYGKDMVSSVYTGAVVKMFAVVLENGITFSFSGKQHVQTKKGMTNIDSLVLGDELLIEGNQYSSIVELVEGSSEDAAFNYTLSRGYFYADSIMVGDYRVESEGIESLSIKAR